MVTLAMYAVFGALPTLGSAGRPVDRYPRIWLNHPGSSPSFSSPYIGNGDIGVAYSVPGRGKDKPGTATQVYSFGKNDLWTSEGNEYFNHMAAPTLEIEWVGANTSQVNTTQDLGAATLRQSMATPDGWALNSSSVVTEAGLGAVLTTISCTGSCTFNLTLRDCCGNNGNFAEDAGATSAGIWFRKENLHQAANEAYMGTCDEEELTYNVERAFVVGGDGQLSMRNGSCLSLLRPETPQNSSITTGPCADPAGRWMLRNESVVWTGGTSELCLTGQMRLEPCAAASKYTMNVTNGFMQSRGRGGDSCVTVVPDNTNNSVAAATVVVESSSGAPVHGKTAPSAWTEAISSVVTLKPGVEYTIITAIVSLRDAGCAGTRADTAKCKQAIENVALGRATELGDVSTRAAAHKTQTTFWTKFWNASAVDLTSGSPDALANVTAVENWYYGMQYSFGTNVRPGKVSPSLSGVLVTMDPVAWHDQFTLDYNLESNYWGAGSSNRVEFMGPYAAAVTSPPLVASMRARTKSRGVWQQGGAKWPGIVGHTTAGSTCGGAASCSAMLDARPSGFNGSAWVSTAFPLGDGRPAPTDLGTRFIGGLLATPLIQIYEYSRDLQALKDFVYPFVRDNAQFYASWADTSGTGPISFPYTCAQEACSCRNGKGWYWRWGSKVMMPLPNMTEETLAAKTRQGDGDGTWDTSAGEHNAHADVAFASASLRKAAEYAKILGVDSDLRARWLALLARMPTYPVQTLTWVKNASAVVVGSELSGKPMLVEAEPAPTSAAAAAVRAAGNSSIIWPWCNVEYPITNFAAMWPTDEVGTFQTKDQALLAAAKTTVYGLNDYTGYVFKGSRRPWDNENGFGLSWPPAVRVSTPDDAATIMSRFATATASAAENGIVSNGGGMLENMGACNAVNEMLMQSHAGAIRLFPVWDAKALGAARFTSLRAYGAFVVSAAIDAAGLVGTVELLSDRGADCKIVSPWPSLKVVEASGAAVTAVKDGEVYTFPTQVGKSYRISSA